MLTCGEAQRDAALSPSAIARGLKAPLPALDPQALESDIVDLCACPNGSRAALLASACARQGIRTWALQGWL